MAPSRPPSSAPPSSTTSGTVAAQAVPAPPLPSTVRQGTGGETDRGDRLRVACPDIAAPPPDPAQQNRLWLPSIPHRFAQPVQLWRRAKLPAIVSSAH